MASPRRARSLFLSPDKAELLAAKEINNLVHRVEIIPRTPVPRQGKRTDIVVETSVGDEIRKSTTSTIQAVDAFCREYRPPSVALHRLSYLNKELPPPPSETPNQTLSQDKTVSRRSTQRHAAAQTTISIQSRYSIRGKSSTSSRLSTISSQHIASQQRSSEDCISIRSRFSTQECTNDQAIPRSNHRASASIDHRRPSVAGDLSKEGVSRRSSRSISPGAVPHQEIHSAIVGRKIEVPGEQEAEIALLACQDKEIPHKSPNSTNIVLRSKFKRETTLGWTFHDGIVMKTDEKLDNTTRVPSGGENLALEPTSKPMIPIRWTFHDGIMHKVTEVPKNEDGISEVKSKRMLPIDWSFYDGITIRPDGPVGRSLEDTGERKESVHGSESKRMIPTGWTFHDGLIFPNHELVKGAHKSPDKSNGTETEASSKRLPIAWTFHDGLSLRTDPEAKNIAKSAPISNGEIIVKSESKRSVGWSFNDGIVIRNGAGSSPKEGDLVTRSKSERSVTWTFNDGLMITAKRRTGPNSERTVTRSKAGRAIGWTFNDGLMIKAKGRTGPNSNRVVTGSKSRRTVGWNFHDGLMISRDGGVARRSPQSRRLATDIMSNRFPLGWSFSDGLTLSQRPNSKGKGKGKGVDRNLHPLVLRTKTMQRRRINYGFWDGITFETADGSSNRGLAQPQPQSRLTWSFHDGVSRKLIDEAAGQVCTQDVGGCFR